MKILQVGSGLRGWAGIEKYVIYLRDGLAERGHEVSVTVAPGTRFADAISGDKIELGVRHKFDLTALSAYLRLYRSNRFDIVHVHFNPDFFVASVAARMAKQGRLVMTRHVALPWQKPKALVFSRLYDRIIPVSEAAERRLMESGVPKSKMRVAKAGCPPPDSFAPRDRIAAELGLGQGFHIGFFGRLAPEKGLRVLLRSAEELPANVTLNFFGEGPLNEEVEAAAKSSHNVRLHGFRSDVGECMHAVDAIVIPSIWEEAFPYSALEAMSVGRPIIASNIGGLPEMVQTDVNGILFEPGNSSALSQAMLRLATENELAVRLGEKGRAIHRAEYTVQRMAERIEAVYSELQ